MPKDSQPDSKEVLKKKAKGGPTMFDDKQQDSRNTKKQSGNKNDI